MKRFKLLVACLVAFVFSNAQLPGYLDFSFGNQGFMQYAITNSYDKLDDVVVQADGKILAIGRVRLNGNNYSISVARHNADGQLDTEFGDNGWIIITPTFNYGNFAMAARVLEDGKIVLGGYTYDSDQPSQAMILKLNSDGSSDTSFGNNGVVFTSGSSETVIEDMEIQSDGKIVLCGYIDDKGSLLRFTADGQVDTSFGNNGIFTLQAPVTNYYYTTSMLIQPDGKIVVAGILMDDGGMYNCLVARVTENGFIDQSFADNGLFLYNIHQGHDFCCNIKRQSDGKIVLGGHTWISNIPTLQYDFMFLRLNEDGSLDTSYGENGMLTARIIDGAEHYILDMSISVDDKIYGSGFIQNGSEADLVIVAVTNTGQINTSFGHNGFSTLDIGEDDQFGAIDMQQDGKLVIGGHTFLENSSDFIMARFYSDAANLTEEFAQTDDLIVYPNPAENYIAITNMAAAENYLVFVYDVDGRLAASFSAETNQHINVSELISGCYFVKLVSTSGVKVGRFIKK